MMLSFRFLVKVVWVLCAFLSTAWAQCAACTHALPCPPGSSNFRTACEAQLNQAISDLLNLGLLKGNMTLITAASCLSDMAENDKIALCAFGGGGFMQTQADCEDRSVDPPRRIWCNIAPANCICIHPGLMQNCNPTFGGDPVSNAAILAAALAHEVCHAKAGSYSSNDGGATFTPPCALICDELNCTCFELLILECVLQSFPNNTPLNNRVFVLTDSKAHWQQEKTNGGC